MTASKYNLFDCKLQRLSHLKNLQYDDTDKRIAKKVEEEERSYRENLELETNRQRKLIDGMMDFKIKDDKIKKQRNTDKLDEKVNFLLIKITFIHYVECSWLP